MPRSIVFVDTYYPVFLERAGFSRAANSAERFDTLRDELLSLGFGTSAAYARAFEEQGWSSQVLIPNALTLQDAWAREAGLNRVWRAGWNYGLHLARLPIARSVLHRLPHIHGLLLRQIAALKPDAVVIQDLNLVPRRLAAALKRHTKVLIGEIASPPPPRSYFVEYDMIVSALPSIVEQARAWGIESHYIPLAFDDSRPASKTPARRDIDAVFIGSFSRHQPQTVPLVTTVAKHVPSLRIYGPASAELIESAGLSAQYAGQAWGSDMFELLRRSKVVVNRHGTIAGPYAVNMRMFEATGSGALLVTENKLNLDQLFEPGREVLTYDTPEQAGEVIANILAQPTKLRAIAKAGQERTLRDHTYRQRARTLRHLIDEVSPRRDSRAR